MQSKSGLNKDHDISLLIRDKSYEVVNKISEATCRMDFSETIMKFEYDYGKITLSFRDPTSEAFTENDICVQTTYKTFMRDEKYLFIVGSAGKDKI